MFLEWMVLVALILATLDSLCGIGSLAVTVAVTIMGFTWSTDFQQVRQTVGTWLEFGIAATRNCIVSGSDIYFGSDGVTLVEPVFQDAVCRPIRQFSTYTPVLWRFCFRIGTGMVGSVWTFANSSPLSQCALIWLMAFGWSNRRSAVTGLNGLYHGSVWVMGTICFVLMFTVRLLAKVLVVWPAMLVWEGVIFPVIWCFGAPFYAIKLVYDRWNNRALMVPITPGEIVEVPLEVKIDQIINLMRGSFKESVQAGSEFFKTSSKPKDVCSLQNSNGTHIGFGFFTVLAGKWVCITTAHVLRDVGAGGRMQGPNATKLILGSWKLVLKSSFDVVAFAVPHDLCTNLGCTKQTLALTPNSGAPVALYGFMAGEFVKTHGNVESPDKRIAFRHTASTIPGFCGTPLISGGKVVGIHMETNTIGHNFALSLDLLIRKKEADTYAEDRHLFGEFSELETEDVDDYFWMDGEGANVRVGRRKYRALQIENDRLALLNTVSDMTRWEERVLDEQIEDLEEVQRWFNETRGQRIKEDNNPSKSLSKDSAGNFPKAQLAVPPRTSSSSLPGSLVLAKDTAPKGTRKRGPKSKKPAVASSATQASSAGNKEAQAAT